MTYLKAILVILMSLQPYYGDKESVEERSARLEVIASSIDRIATYGACDQGDPDCDDKAWKQIDEKDGRLALTAMLITIGRFETALAKHVHEGRCRVKQGECDGGRARGPWQFQPTRLVRKQWYACRGADQKSTDACAWGATLTLTNAYKNCMTWRGAIAQYATGGTCTWKPQQVRYEFFLKTKAKLAELVGEELDDDED